MSEKTPKILIIGDHQAGLTAIRIAEIKVEHRNLEVVILGDVTYQYKARPPLPELQQIILNDNFFSDVKSSRNKRRKAKRKVKKNKR